MVKFFIAWCVAQFAYVIYSFQTEIDANTSFVDLILRTLGEVSLITLIVFVALVIIKSLPYRQ